MQVRTSGGMLSKAVLHTSSWSAGVRGSVRVCVYMCTTAVGVGVEFMYVDKWWSEEGCSSSLLD